MQVNTGSVVALADAVSARCGEGRSLLVREDFPYNPHPLIFRASGFGMRAFQSTS